jgi:hypothetical protein
VFAHAKGIPGDMQVGAKDPVSATAD